MSILLLAASDGENVVDVNGNNIGSHVVIIDAPLTHEVSEAPSKHRTVKLLIPNPSTLTHTIQTLMKFPHPGFLARCGEAFRLFHELDLIVWQDSIQVSSFDIKLLGVPVTCSSNM